MESQNDGARAEREFEERGVYVQRDACGKHACAASFEGINRGLDKMLALPGREAFGGRLMVKVATSSKEKVLDVASHRSEFAFPFSSAEDVVRMCVSDAAVSAVLSSSVGLDAELRECTVIAAEPSATAQDLHSDGDWGGRAPRVVTLFIALHDILDEAMGPTHYCPETQAPRCFSGGKWMSPMDPQAHSREAVPVWFQLHAGDVIIMEQTCWHFGGANTSDKRRILLCATFVQACERRTGGPKGKKSNVALRLRDLMAESRRQGGQ
eukprot:TRINITY_DN73211_c0_g1_i1.p1 TRINITY_DN73211_c0_g1~~TRINITY_DN73211_c0_g1_i1.p1  ORF type:complete len:267 (-),score=36.10 TRINITY_DN73211_c0_g1_i1:20-820(-)